MRSTHVNQSPHPPDSAPTAAHGLTPRRLGLVAISVLTVIGVVAFATGCGRFRSHHDDNQGSGTPSGSTSVSVPTGSSTQKLTVGGMDRTYRLYVPSSLSFTSKVPLVVMMHGALGSGRQAEREYGWDEKADSAHFVVAYPDGYHRTWNAGNCCGPAQQKHVDDVGFIKKMVSTLSSEMPIDQSRIYATGISNGGLMAYQLACTTNIFAAIGPDSATMLRSCTSPNPTSVIHIHGTDDHTIPYNGGHGQRTKNADWPSVPHTIAQWRSIDDCQSPSDSTSGSVTKSVAQCADGRTVELITISGAGHQWPGGKSDNIVEKKMGLDEPSQALNATDTFWNFFTSHPKES